jgi:hypothetical protein
VGLRFHVDSRKFRTWGVNDEGSIACALSYQIAHAKEAGSNVPDPANASSPQPPSPPVSPDPKS